MADPRGGWSRFVAPFDAKLPPIDDAVEIVEADGRVIVAEIEAHLDAHRARAIAPASRAGSKRPLCRKGDELALRSRVWGDIVDSTERLPLSTTLHTIAQASYPI